MAPILPLLLVGIGGIAALAMGGKKKGAPSSGTYELDANLPADQASQVLGAIANVKDPNALLQYAAQMQQAGYPLAAAALMGRAAQLNVAPNMPPPTPVQQQPTAPPGTSPLDIPPPPLPPPAPPGQPQQVLYDPNLDDSTRAAVLQAIASEVDPAKLQAFADTLAATFPLAAAALRARALQLPVIVPPGGHPIPPPGDIGPPLPPPSLPVSPPPPQPAPPPAPSPNGQPPAPPPQGQVWVLATNADVAKDGTQARYTAILNSQPVGYEVHETWNGRLWKFRVISNTTDPGLTTYAKDVKGWIAQNASLVQPPAPAPVPVPVLPLPSAPPLVQPAVYVPPSAPSSPPTPIQAAAIAMRNALNAHGYKQADQGIYKAFEALAFPGKQPDGFPGTGNMQALKPVLDSLGLPMPNVPVYPWHGKPGTSGYDGINAPTWAQWTSPPAATSGAVWGPS